MRDKDAQRRDSAQALEFRQYVIVSDVFIVGVKRAGAVLLLCFLLNLPAPFIIAAQRTLPTSGTESVTYDGPVELTRETILGPGQSRKEVTVDTRILLDGNEYRDSYTANRSSAFPVRDRGGLTYFFPYRPERRSYPYSDPFSLSAVPLDYAGMGSVGGLETYKYRAVIDDGDYHAERIFDLERRTGRVLDETWTVAGGLAEGFFRLSEQSRVEALDAARDEVAILRVLQVLAWGTRFVAVLTLVGLAVAFARR
ncbi:hypothetical protein CAPI_08690 [Corynebacterium capitovis DSM 44611]|uniref:porin PorA family protein n=1 Tax=Corynebacterium capitovis TaxID=131081 RepID=UPI0003A01BAD|nr:porin PorA family protein [Corynebacterium capitovis]WKD58264.1 hypothetical protein CAPI_08690 [Corynebacterium capitovis DSM 44611]